MDFVLSGMIRNLELGGAPDLEPRRAWFPREHLLALPAEELGRIEPSPEAGDDVLIAVLERCRELCGRYGLQPDYQLGAIHSPDTEQSGVRYLYTRIKEAADCPYYREKPAGKYLYLCCRGRWDISGGYDALTRYMEEQGVRTSGRVYACDLAGFILNSVEKNAASMISVRLAGQGLFEKWQHAQRAALLPPYIAGFPCNPPRIPASNRLHLAAKFLALGHISIFQTAPEKRNVVSRKSFLFDSFSFSKEKE